MELDGSNYKWNPNGAMAHILVLSLSKEKDSSKIFDFYYSIKSFNKLEAIKKVDENQQICMNARSCVRAPTPNVIRQKILCTWLKESLLFLFNTMCAKNFDYELQFLWLM